MAKQLHREPHEEIGYIQSTRELAQVGLGLGERKSIPLE